MRLLRWLLRALEAAPAGCPECDCAFKDWARVSCQTR